MLFINFVIIISNNSSSPLLTNLHRKSFLDESRKENVPDVAAITAVNSSELSKIWDSGNTSDDQSSKHRISANKPVFSFFHPFEYIHYMDNYNRRKAASFDV